MNGQLTLLRPQRFRSKNYLMKSAILGISALGHDSAAALVDADSGAVLYAIAEERLTNQKHASRFPIASIRAAEAFGHEAGYKIETVALNFVPKEFSTGTLKRAIEKDVSDVAVRDSLWNAIENL